MTAVEQLFDEFAVRFRRGERPDLREYLRRAGPEADELATLVDRFLQAAPAPEPDADTLAAASAWVEGESPLLELRTRRGLRRASVVDALVSRLGLDPRKREKVARYYHELETGLLDAKSVDTRVWETLAAALDSGIDAIRAWTRPPARAAPTPAYFRLEDAAVADALSAVPPPPDEEPDEIDRLFGGRPDGDGQEADRAGLERDP